MTIEALFLLDLAMANLKTSRKQSIDWSRIGDEVCEILSVTRDYPNGLVEFAREQSVPYESVVAAAITQRISELVEVELAKKSRRRAPKTKSVRAV